MSEMHEYYGTGFVFIGTHLFKT